ncbi:sulfite exporter TauE/SafE family protein [Halovenus salina]|uniref:sulfite exporter TauE/SafE family protein n=1 Tax=Halovenus salina TaxID=1510225 RepID=UPI00226082A8|nr:sulfite exporter TauE/SafE family protein [Halovenus salina]
MTLTLTPLFLLGVGVLFLVAGAVNGLAGFGFALVGTMTLATVVVPATAVVFMIVPILGVNISLVGELSAGEIRSCGRRFAPLLVSTLLGTVAGMAAIDALPESPLRLLLGIVSLGFVVSAQPLVSVPGLDRAREGCFVETTPAMVGVGGLSGLVFGGTNVGVQLVAFLRSCDLSHGLFVGVVALVFLGLNAARVAAAGVLGLYPDAVVFAVSVGAVLPAVAGVAVGRRLRARVSERVRQSVVLGLLTVIGLRLVGAGLGLVG